MTCLPCDKYNKRTLRVRGAPPEPWAPPLFYVPPNGGGDLHSGRVEVTPQLSTAESSLGPVPCLLFDGLDSPNVAFISKQGMLEDGGGMWRVVDKGGRRRTKAEEGE